MAQVMDRELAQVMGKAPGLAPARVLKEMTPEAEPARSTAESGAETQPVRVAVESGAERAPVAVELPVQKGLRAPEPCILARARSEAVQAAEPTPALRPPRACYNTAQARESERQDPTFRAVVQAVRMTQGDSHHIGAKKTKTSSEF